MFSLFSKVLKKIYIYIETTIYLMQLCWTYKFVILNKLILKIVDITYHGMINIKDFYSSLIKIDKKSYKEIGIYNIGYITTKNLMIMKILIV